MRYPRMTIIGTIRIIAFDISLFPFPFGAVAFAAFVTIGDVIDEGVGDVIDEAIVLLGDVFIVVLGVAVVPLAASFLGATVAFFGLAADNDATVQKFKQKLVSINFNSWTKWYEKNTL